MSTKNCVTACNSEPLASVQGFAPIICIELMAFYAPRHCQSHTPLCEFHTFSFSMYLYSQGSASSKETSKVSSHPKTSTVSRVKVQRKA